MLAKFDQGGPSFGSSHLQRLHPDRGTKIFGHNYIKFAWCLIVSCLKTCHITIAFIESNHPEITFSSDKKYKSTLGQFVIDEMFHAITSQDSVLQKLQSEAQGQWSKQTKRKVKVIWAIKPWHIWGAFYSRDKVIKNASKNDETKTKKEQKINIVKGNKLVFHNRIMHVAKGYSCSITAKNLNFIVFYLQRFLLFIAYCKRIRYECTKK